MMTTIDVNKVVGVQEENTSILGYLCWFTIHEVKYKVDHIKSIMQDVGIPESYHPKAINDVDAFKRATSSLEKEKLPTNDPNIYENILIRDVSNNKNAVVRKVVKETVDANNRRLAYKETADIILDKKTGRIEMISLGNESFDINIEKVYKEYKENYDGSHIRRIVRDILWSMNPIAVRPSGGVYFVPKMHKEMLEKLENFVEKINCEFFTIPLMDQAKSRDMLYEKYNEQIDQSIKEIKELIITEQNPQKLSKILSQTANMMKEIEMYETMLNKDLEHLKEKVNIIKKQINYILINS
ncbi:MAG: DUF6744 family protein [Thermovenabulum sp.]|uniref:DUF6744 family protein n=1 Tax=Thermovenabulum sp. TaxID=3100335 RepID=UPI003C7A7AC0